MLWLEERCKMRSMKWINNKFSPTARLGYGIAGAALVVLPALVAYREGIAGLPAEAVVAALFGVGYLMAAALGGEFAS
jgi:hypothetical protein